MTYPRAVAMEPDSASALLLALCVAAQDGGAASERAPLPPSGVDEWEARLGWRALFDGRTPDGWHAYGKEAFPEQGWSVDEGALYHAAKGGGGDLVTDEAFGDFELAFEWRVAAGANSGVKIRFEETPARGTLGPEYQILDDAGHRDGTRPETSAGALYALYAPAPEKELVPAGEWNRARIVSIGDRIEHWLNGRRVVEARVGSSDWAERVAASKFAEKEGFAEVVPSPIALQDHGDDVWFRRLRIRDPGNPPGELAALFDGATLAGWHALGDAIYEVDDGAILGRIGGGGQSFLATDASFGDFVLELELKTELPGNSGIQIRSREANGRLTGYQVEIDPSERAWSGGLYYEGGGWLQDLSENEPGRRAFRHGEWNHYRIECAGPVVRVWVNGIPTVDYAEARERSGVIGLQVHSGNDTRVRWKNVRVWNLE